jgi:hypothetical protein
VPWDGGAAELQKIDKILKNIKEKERETKKNKRMKLGIHGLKECERRLKKK